jgi:hypothetical protein
VETTERRGNKSTSALAGHCFSGAHRPLLSTSITTNNAELEQLFNKHMTDLHYMFLCQQGEERDIKYCSVQHRNIFRFLRILKILNSRENITMFLYAKGQNSECHEFINLWRRELASNLLLFYLICALDIPSLLKLFVFYVDDGVLLLSSQYRREGRNCQMLSEMSTSTLPKKESGAVLRTNNLSARGDFFKKVPRIKEVRRRVLCVSEFIINHQHKNSLFSLLRDFKCPRRVRARKLSN